MAKEGLKKVPIAGIDGKRQITLVLAADMTGKLLPLQLVYQGKTKACLLTVDFPADWDVTFSPNHWCNEITMDHYVRNVIVPYVQDTRKNLHLDANHRAVCIFDNFKAQRTDGILQLLEDNNIDSVFVPANCTGELQPMDLSVNKSVKNFMRAQFQDWYAAEVFKSYEDSGTEIKPVKFPMSQMKLSGSEGCMITCLLILISYEMVLKQQVLWTVLVNDRYLYCVCIQLENDSNSLLIFIFKTHY